MNKVLRFAPNSNEEKNEASDMTVLPRPKSVISALMVSYPADYSRSGEMALTPAVMLSRPPKLFHIWAIMDARISQRSWIFPHAALFLFQTVDLVTYTY
jgi:hypothetical protein